MNDYSACAGPRGQSNFSWDPQDRYSRGLGGFNDTWVVATGPEGRAVTGDALRQTGTENTADVIERRRSHIRDPWIDWKGRARDDLPVRSGLFTTAVTKPPPCE